ncbi:hypothetical protein LXT13_00570 [Pelomonas sp. P8]|uniref:HipA N-terminal subdomain 1 domain-containing protein n=1 Tax=Pelomonas cellulosilytica TaxID=2906762 RepID=A0ABS8XJA4_9BURK|nr:hypothetical protein [Pelomonas sp. P8]
MSALQVSHFGVSVSVTQIGRSQKEFLFFRNFTGLPVSIKRNFGKPEIDCQRLFANDLFPIFRNVRAWASYPREDGLPPGIPGAMTEP